MMIMMMIVTTRLVSRNINLRQTTELYKNTIYFYNTKTQSEIVSAKHQKPNSVHTSIKRLVSMQGPSRALWCGGQSACLAPGRPGFESGWGNIRKIRPYLTRYATQRLVQTLGSSRLDYCNALLTGLPACVVKPLQMIQNAAARLVFNQPKSA